MVERLVEDNPRFKYVYDVMSNELYDITKAKSLYYLSYNLAQENLQLRGEVTELKLVLNAILDDLEETRQYAYADWVRDNCNPEFLSKKNNREIKNKKFKVRSYPESDGEDSISHHYILNEMDREVCELITERDCKVVVKYINERWFK